MRCPPRAAKWPPSPGSPDPSPWSSAAARRPKTHSAAGRRPGACPGAGTARAARRAGDRASLLLGRVRGGGAERRTGDQTMRIAAACALLLGVAWVGGCLDENPAGPNGTGALGGPGAPIVSDPLPAAAARAAARSVSQATGTDVVYVSLQPGTVPNGGLATIRNTRTGSSVTAAMDGGGFDPVPIDAQAGDVLAVQVELTGGGTETLTCRVPVTHRPGVVRTDPPPGKRDVPLNARIVVVFSEPINPGTVSGIRLLRGAAPLAGHTTLSADGLRAEFQPAGLLAANAAFALSIPEGVADLTGDRLQQPVTTEFATGSTLIAASVATAQPALITDPLRGDLRTFVMSGCDARRDQRSEE